MTFAFQKTLKAMVADRMAAELPRFEAVPAKSILLYRARHDDDAFFFVAFQSETRSHEAFTVELALSPNDAWPEAADASTIPVDIPERRLIRQRPRAGVFRCRIGFLFPPQKDHWWELTPKPSFEELMAALENLGAEPPSHGTPEEKAQKLASLVSDAVAKIRDHGIPYLIELQREIRTGS